MKIWRPKDRGNWWIGFFISLIIIPFFVILVGVGFMEQFHAPSMYLFAEATAPLSACYLVLVSRLKPLVKIIIVPILFLAITVAYAPRSTCGSDEEQPVNINGLNERSVSECNA